ncbi:MAG: YifB family Mg chelatase-like AAA ATPase [Lachnospiraceae bacterium]|nr:YifB family Mg chelatase-like AAA ATPase [Lachnospiraceae bacterium]
MFCSLQSFSVTGIEAAVIKVEVDVGNGLPCFDMVGYLSSEVKEARERVRVALRNSGYPVPAKRITVNLSPADERKGGTGYDLAIALGILCNQGFLPWDVTEGAGILGELGLDGTVRAVPGVLPCVIAAKKAGFHSVLLPAENAEEGALVEGIRVYGVRTLTEAVEHFTGVGGTLAKPVRFRPDESTAEDFCDIHGQFLAKRAAEIAAAGMHNLLLSGPPGAGKTMLARRIPGILPKLTFEESLEITKVYSVAGLVPSEGGMLKKRPFRAPHHTATVTALAGGGRSPMPGEMSLASGGVLFLDELPEFPRASIEILRQPLEERCIQVARLQGSVLYPASFMLVAAMNPCPCGYYPDRNRCRCTPDQITRYRSRISRPILDRIDISVVVHGLSPKELTGGSNGEKSAAVRKRVEIARRRQAKRYKGTSFRYNSDVPGSQLSEFFAVTGEAERVASEYAERTNCTARGYHRMWKVARTIADLTDSEKVLPEHMAEAAGFRTEWR